MSSKFVSILETVGKDIKKALDFILPYAQTVGETAVSIYAPGLGPIFNATVSAVMTAEANFAAIGKSSGSGASKLAAVTSVVGGLIKQALADAGKASDDAAVQSYINGVVQVLNAAPAPTATPTSS
jgi:hypothetical protein